MTKRYAILTYNRKTACGGSPRFMPGASAEYEVIVKVVYTYGCIDSYEV
ncbi:hypothetical protein [Paenibacillus sp. PAMC21692]|nr:hypothetical protein [Paenibacillus sp. PAMC21692]QNK56630.1 hypothetical protein H7F31_29545 [Paenibacillus sp. PAMC21692]